MNEQEPEPAENTMSEVELLRSEVQQHRELVAVIESQLAQAREAIEEQAAGFEEVRTMMISEHRERMEVRLNRWQADSDEKQARIDTILATDQGQAYADVEQWKRQVERAEERANRADGRAIQAERDRDRALESVAGGENIHPADPRVAHIWRKASRIASNKGYCSEYDHIADALGLPEIEFEYEGSVTLNVTAYVTVPVSGTATRQQIADGDIDYDIDESLIVESLDTDTIRWEVDQVEIAADDDDDE